MPTKTKPKNPLDKLGGKEILLTLQFENGQERHYSSLPPDGAPMFQEEMRRLHTMRSSMEHVFGNPLLPKIRLGNMDGTIGKESEPMRKIIIYSEQERNSRWPSLMLLQTPQGQLTLVKNGQDVGMGSEKMFHVYNGWVLMVSISLGEWGTPPIVDPALFAKLAAFGDMIEGHMLRFPEPPEIANALKDKKTQEGIAPIIPFLFFLNGEEHLTKNDARRERAALKAKKKELGRDKLTAAEIHSVMSDERERREHRRLMVDADRTAVKEVLDRSAVQVERSQAEENTVGNVLVKRANARRESFETAAKRGARRPSMKIGGLKKGAKAAAKNKTHKSKRITGKKS